MTVGSAKRALCKGIRKDGTTCGGTALEDGYCWAHSPRREGERLEARRKGGYASARVARLGKLVPPRLSSLYDTLEEALEKVYKGELDPRIAVAMSSLAGAMVRVLTAGEMEDRLRRLEERMEPQSQKRREQR